MFMLSKHFERSVLRISRRILCENANPKIASVGHCPRKGKPLAEGEQRRLMLADN